MWTGSRATTTVARYPEARLVPGLLLYRFDAPLFFANANVFRQRLLQRIAAADPPVRWVVIAAEPMTDVDPTAAEVLEDVADDLREAGIELAFAEMKDPVRDRLERYGLVERFGRDRFFPTIGSAVHAYVDATGVEWVDWEDAGMEPRVPVEPSAGSDFQRAGSRSLTMQAGGYACRPRYLPCAGGIGPSRENDGSWTNDAPGAAQTREKP